MSPIFSTKHLPARPAPGAALFADETCSHCGYSLRGLRRGRRCPECGNAQNTPLPGASDILDRGAPGLRWRWRAGLLLGSVCLLVVVLARWVLLVGGVNGASDALATAYLVTGLAVAIAWNLATWLVAPSSLDTLAPGLAKVRWIVRATQALWIVGMALWLIRFRSTPGTVIAFASDDALQSAQLLCRGIAGAGALLLAWLLMRVAGHASLEGAERRLNAVIWGLPILTILTQAFPATLEWFFLISLGLLLLGWSWFMWLYSRAMLDMHAHTRWAMIHRRDDRSRGARTEAMRQELQREASQQVRPIPRHADDEKPIPLE